jgi:methylamine dehydrogenase accessory protein MauD
MNTFFFISYFALWALFLVQSVAILLLLRQVGVLHLRIGPIGARVMPAGPEIGQAAPAGVIEDMDDPKKWWKIGPEMESDVMMVFVNPHCAACDSLMVAVRSLAAQSEQDLCWAVVTYGGRQACIKFRLKHHLQNLLVAYSPNIRNQYNIGATPYAVLIRKDGTVISKGLTNQIEHLESIP